jgi:serine/threonine-protein kinase
MSTTFGKYVLLRKLATGGMGEVFLARPAEPARASERLVIKRILPHLAEDTEFHDMFLDEARIAAQLDHPNIVHIFEVGEVGESVYLAMDYVHGEDLRSVERAAKLVHQRLPLAVATHIVAAAAAGLEHAHALRGPDDKKLNLVHRDVSPQNILVGFAGEVKLIDFGVAKAAGLGQPTVTGVLKGKCAYMSPEQAAGDNMDARSDVFSLGVVWWELITGRRLFKGSSDQMTMRLVLGCQVPPPSRLDSGLPVEVDEIVAQVLTRHPKDRYADAGRFRTALETFLRNQGASPDPVQAQIALLRQLFKDRLERAAEIQAEEEVGREEPTGELPGAYRSRSFPSLPARSGALSGAEEENTQSVTLTAIARRKRRWLIAAAAGFLLALGTLALLVR